MKIKEIGALILFLIIITSCAEKQRTGLSNEMKNKLDAYVEAAMEVHQIPGMALAVVKEGNVIYNTYNGKASLEDGIAVDDNTVFRVFSTTKLITATGIFQLVEKGKISLDDKISGYFDNLPDPWKQVRIKHLLSHSSGLPDLRYPPELTDAEVMQGLFSDQMDFHTGDRFRYNQTNYWLLAQIIEKVTQVPFDAYILNNQFAESNGGVFFSSDSKQEIEGRATRYYYDARNDSFRKDTLNNGKRAHSGNGLNISLNEFIAWNKHLNNGEFIKEKTKSAMWTPFQFANEKDDFLHGWGTYTVSGKTSYGFTGGNLSAFRTFVDDDLTIILLSNGYVHPGYDMMINDISKLIFHESGNSEPILEQHIMKLLLEQDYKAAKSSYNKMRQQDPDYSFDNLKWNINGMGNSLLWSDHIDEACVVFKLNAEVNSEWWVAQASYAEALEKKDDFVSAIPLYKKAIELNTDNAYDYNPLMTKKIDELKQRE